MAKRKYKTNITGRIIAAIYLIFAYQFANDIFGNPISGYPFGLFSLILLGAFIITTVFDRFVKYDFFRNDQ
ncbi:hypothetical protein [Paenibacillus sp. WLX2291]|uniref:hypothetical protein n=1 Tax=Paenibacillus sp. WLX2291 TaxID=3296934 RepID=UPI0039845016